MSFKKRFVRLISSVIASIVLILSIMCPVWADPVVKIQLYDKELSTSHLHADEMAQYAIYLIDRTILYYQMAMLTGDTSFLREIEPMLTDAANSLDIFLKTPGCRAGKVAPSIDTIKYLIKENLKIINDIIANTNVETTYNAAEMHALIAEVDSLNDVVLNEINPVIGPAELDVLSLGSMGLAIRANQQILIRSISNSLEPSARLDELITFAENEYEYNIYIFEIMLQRGISRTTDAALIKNKKSIMESTFQVTDMTSKLRQHISEFKFPSKPALDIQNDFLKTMEIISIVIQKDILNSAFS